MSERLIDSYVVFVALFRGFLYNRDTCLLLAVLLDCLDMFVRPGCIVELSRYICKTSFVGCVVGLSRYVCKTSFVDCDVGLSRYVGKT